MLYLHALSPVHTGTGQGIGYIDQPVAREKITGWPIIPGSSVKGVLRAHGTEKDGAMAKIVFGPDTDKASDHAGAVWFPDAHLIALPVRSLYGSFAWITCPLALQRWQRDRKGAGDTAFAVAPIALPAGNLSALVAPGNALAQNGSIYLEDYDLAATEDDRVGTLANALADEVFEEDDWKKLFSNRLEIVSDFVFQQFATTSLDVLARIRLNEKTKTVAQGGLWYEEAIPAESIFAAPLLVGEVKLQEVHGVDEASLWTHLHALLDDQMLQIGGNASVGRGLVRGILGTPGAGGDPAGDAEGAPA